MIKKIIRNETGSMLQILNREIANGSSYDIAPHMWSELASDSAIQALVTGGTLVVNDGNVDLTAVVGTDHIANPAGVVHEHSDITLLPAVTEMAPSLIRVSNAVIGSSFAVDEEIFAQTRIDNLSGDSVSFQMHMGINNAVADRWVKFLLSYWTSNGSGDQNINAILGTVDLGPILVPTTPYQIFEANVDIPASAFSNGEHYLFVGVKRVVATGKTAPSANPIILRYCKRFYKRLQS